MKKLQKFFIKCKQILFPTLKRVKTPTVLQMERVECGAAALGIILAYYKKFIPLEELRVTCGISRDGSKALNIVKAARHYGLEAKGFSKEIGELREIQLPFMVFWNFNHFLVVEGFRHDGIYLNDPASGPRIVGHEEFDKAFTGVILTFNPSDHFQPSGTQKNVLRSLYQRLQGSGVDLLYVVIAGIALTIPGIAIPIFSKIFVDDYLVEKTQGIIIPLLLGLLFAAVMRFVLTWLQQSQLLRLQTKLTLTMSSSFLWHVLRLPMTFFNQRYAGDITQRIDSNNRVAQLISGDLASNAVNIISVIFYGILMFWYDVRLTIIGILFMLLNIIALRRVTRERKDENLNLLQERGKLISTTLGGIKTIETIKATGGENDFFFRWAGYQAKMINSTQTLELHTRFLSVLPTLFTGLMSAVILGIGGYRVMEGSLTIGTLVAFQILMMNFSTPINNLVALGAKFQNAAGDLTRLDDVLDYQPDPIVTQKNLTTVTSGKKLTGHLELRNVTFGYSRLEPPLIENLTLQLKPGSRIALVGSSGSGKSTILKLVTGINQLWSGEILFDGQPREIIPREILTNSLTSVDQDITLFEGTIYQNLTLWDEIIPQIDVIQAAKDACIHEIITARTKGYDTQIGEEGSNFSGGEKQRIEIARALTLNPALLLLDEATAALDPIMEKMIDDNIKKRNCTCLIAAHRLSTIRDCDEIIVLDHGKVVQRGTHESLRQEGGIYATLIQLESREE